MFQCVFGYKLFTKNILKKWNRNIQFQITVTYFVKGLWANREEKEIARNMFIHLLSGYKLSKILGQVNKILNNVTEMQQTDCVNAKLLTDKLTN